MSYPSRGTDLAKSVQSFASRRPWPGDHLHRNPRSYDATSHWICRFGPRRKRPVTPVPHETSPIKLLPSLAVTCTSNT